MKLSKQEKLDIFENAISWIVVLAMFVYGFGKIIQFGDTSQNHTPVSALTGMELMWAFYGYSKPFVFVIGFLEILGGSLILWKKTRIIGCLLTSTILVNVIIQDIFFHVLSGALRAAILYQFFIFLILWLHREKIKESFNKLLLHKTITKTWAELIIQLGLAFLLFVALRIAEYYFCAFSF